MFGEPPRTQYDLVFNLFGIPVRVHPFFWVAGLFFSGALDMKMDRTGIIAIVMGLFAFFIVILVHELGHALVLKLRYRQRPWIVLYGFGGLTIHDPGFGRQPGTLGSILISASGPFSGFAMVGILWLIVIACGGNWVFAQASLIPVPIVLFELKPLTDMVPIWYFLVRFNFFCIVWGVLNLLPIYPFDGGQISREIFLWFTRRNGIVYSLRLSIIIAIILCFYSFFGWYTYRDMEGIPFMGIFFGGFAYLNYVTLERYSGRFR